MSKRQIQRLPNQTCWLGTIVERYSVDNEMRTQRTVWSYGVDGGYHDARCYQGVMRPCYSGLNERGAFPSSGP